MKFYWGYLSFILLEISVFACVSGAANQKLRYYEVIDSADLRHEIQKRSLLNEGENHRKEITLSVLGRTFELSLAPKPELFSEQFEAVAVNGHGKETEFIVNKNDFYRGYVKGEEDSSVTMDIDEDMITAAIETKGDTYHLEPAAGKIDGDTKNKMIAYRDSDVLWNVTFARNHTQQERYCGMAEAGERSETHDPPSGERKSERDRRSTRTRRELKVKRDCSLVLVADYLYFKNIGQGSKMKTLHAMVSIINRVDVIFRNTDWSLDDTDQYKGFGFFIKKIIIHEKPTSYENSEDLSGCNKVYTTASDSKSLLEEFSRNDWHDYCLAHLFTYQDFADGIIGLAYRAKLHPYPVREGICGEKYCGMFYNTGLSSSINWGKRLLTTEAVIVTAHEFGHNFGSHHDDQSRVMAENQECWPEEGGKYLMSPASISGEKPNNKRFSPCSKRAVKEVLEERANDCFSLPNAGSLCGNYRVDMDEDCDPGYNVKGDPCCDKECKLKEGANCSDANDQCCSNCQFAVNTTQCAQAQPLICSKAAYCNGSSKECPNPPYADEGTACIERGKCNDKGVCQPFCKSLGPNFEPCLCRNEADACFVCCKNEKMNKTCAVHRNTTSGRLAMSDGRLCYNGVCRGQKCERIAQDLVARIQHFFQTLGDPSKFRELLKDNIVGTVIVFSLFAWIPLSIIVHRIDKRRDKQAQELARWQDAGNQDLIRHPNKRRGNFDVVFKKDAVLIRDSRKGRGVKPRTPRGPTVQ